MVLSILTFKFDLIWGLFLTFWCLIHLLSVSGLGSNTVLGSTKLVEQLYTFEFDSILVSCLLFVAKMAIFWGRARVWKNVFEYTHIWTTFFSMFSLVLTCDFDLILGSLLNFWSPNGLFVGYGTVKVLFWVVLI